MTFLHVAAYQFTPLTTAWLSHWAVAFKEKAVACQLKGTILLSTEGINLGIAGLPAQIAEFQIFLSQWVPLAELWYKESPTKTMPYDKMVVKVKKEIISMGTPNFLTEEKAAPYIEPETLKQWYQESHEMVILDTRNRFEIEWGGFEQAIHLDLEHFRDFPNAAAILPASLKEKKIITCCTGGIRCEKAATYLLKQGFREVYQLKGGILNYFDQCGGEYYWGQCFVFDNRVALNSQLVEVSDG